MWKADSAGIQPTSGIAYYKRLKQNAAFLFVFESYTVSSLAAEQIRGNPD
jgi:hypothetical protein